MPRCRADRQTHCSKTRRYLALLLASLSPLTLSAQNPLSVSAPEKLNSAEAELASFTLADDLEANLFADESMGIANPVCMAWDASDRLWVLCSWAYPQLAPDQKPSDKLMILEDTDQDGRADKVSVFADGLNMPTGFALGHGGVYLGEGADLLHLKDTDGDGKADSRELLFTGFGTGDTHQNINSFTWTPGGELLFSQGLHCFSHVQTPWGNTHLEEHGTWRLQPLRRKLSSFRRTSGGGNPWGHAFGHWGEPFIKSNGPGICELLPSMIETDHLGGGYWGGEMKIGATAIKSMIIERIDSPHLPDDFQGDFIIAGYFARNIARLKPSPNGAGHQLKTLEPILTSSHNAFRPVDIKTGPDGALYVADWFNPIIGHYQASFRHPDRDKTHGRIWRITAKDRPLIPRKPLATLSASELCEQLAAPHQRTRNLAKLRLMEMPQEKVIAALDAWISSLAPTDPDLEHHWHEAIGVYESHEVPNPELLDKLLEANEPLARAYATRVAGRWHDRIGGGMERLQRSAQDPHPRVRLETIVAVSGIRTNDSIVIAAEAAGDSQDRFIRFAMQQCVHALKDIWKPALLAGELEFTQPSHLTRIVSDLGGDEVLAVIRTKLNDPAMLVLLATLGNTADAQKVLELGTDRAPILNALAASASGRGLQSPPDASKLIGPHLHHTDANVRSASATLVGAWKLTAHTGTIRSMTQDESAEVRRAAIDALAPFDDLETITLLAQLLSTTNDPEISAAAARSISRHAPESAAVLILKRLPKAGDTETAALLTAILGRSAGAKALASSLDGASKETAIKIRHWLNATGRSDEELTSSLNRITETEATIREHSDKLVSELVSQALAKGDVARGRAVFMKPSTACASCHIAGELKAAVSAMNGPNLSAVAAGLPPELLVESLLWPSRQIKEGYQAVTITTKDGTLASGFLHAEDKSSVSIRELTSGKTVQIRKDQIAQRSAGFSVMPPGLTDTLPKSELLDLIRFLTSLKNPE